MFSHLCRTCLNELSDPLDIVPLFEEYHNVFYYRICNAIQLSVQHHDKLGRNICKPCAENIMKFYNFHLMYKKSDLKLRQMLLGETTDLSLDTVEKKPNVNVELNIEEMGSIVQTSLQTTDSKWKCRICSAGFATRSLLRNHRTQVHPTKNDQDLIIPKRQAADLSVWDSNNGTKQRIWKCVHCSEHFRTRRLKYQHQKDFHQHEATESSNDDCNDYVNNEFPFSNDVKADTDENSSDQMEFKYSPDLTSESMLNSHCSEVNNEFDSFDQCEPDDTDMQTVNNHSIDIVDEKWKCKKCSNCFLTRNLLRDHNQHQHLKRKKESFPSEVELAVQTNMKIQQIKTEIDNIVNGDTVVDTKQFIAEVPNNRNVLRWKCTKCLCVLETRELLRIHRRNHLGNPHNTQQTEMKQWHCAICEDIFATRKLLQQHRREQHVHDRKPRKSHDDNWGEYICEICNKTFNSKSKIKKHMDTHKNKDRKQRLCVICGLRLCSTYNLNTHIRVVHGGERNYQCLQCNRRFSHGHHLKTHMNRHDGIRPHPCSLCPKSFFDTSTLRSHIKSVHLNLKQYVCKICSKAFNRNGNLRAHMLKTHHLGQPESRVSV